jgi:hypothetical protein
MVSELVTSAVGHLFFFLVVLNHGE